MSANAPQTVILGIGNILLTDDGAGIRAMEHFMAHHDRGGLRFVDGGTLSFALAVEIETCRNLIVFDAAELKSVPGTVRAYVGDELDGFLRRRGKASVHEVGLIDLLAVAALSDALPVNRALVAIQTQATDWGEVLSPLVAEAIPRAANLAAEVIQSWN